MIMTVVSIGNHWLLVILGDGFLKLDPVVHVLILVPIMCGGFGIWFVFTYRAIYTDRRDDFSLMIKYLHTRDPSLLIIPTPSRQATQLWIVAYVIYLAWRVVSAALSSIMIAGLM